MAVVVWFKRDLRVEDHGPLCAAVQSGQPVIPLYVVEQEYWQQPDTSRRQWQFVAESLESLRKQLKRLGSDLLIAHGEVIRTLDDLKQQYGITQVFCHQETGGDWTFQRDKAVIAWCQSQQIEFREWQGFGVVRRLVNRDDWDQHWNRIIKSTRLPAPEGIRSPDTSGWPQSLPAPAQLNGGPCPDRQAG
ncbi:MAG: deoxyribodipyrimidine photo-lyase, partial [Pseudomonadota bacterium]|nr:deoxyribodipyrimidine photo-lyase [Pseudomonadota bacterium]